MDYFPAGRDPAAVAAEIAAPAVADPAVVAPTVVAPAVAGPAEFVAVVVADKEVDYPEADGPIHLTSPHLG
jgi:hypothetical protein